MSRELVLLPPVRAETDGKSGHRHFGGLTEEEIAAVLKISPRTVRRDWDLARAWLLLELRHKIGEPPVPQP